MKKKLLVIGSVIAGLLLLAVLAIDLSVGRQMVALGAFAGLPKGRDTDIHQLSADVRVAPDGMRVEGLTLGKPENGVPFCIQGTTENPSFVGDEGARRAARPEAVTAA